MNEQQVALAFSRQAPVFDAYYESDPIIRYKRQRVRERLLKDVAPGSHILELNAGTGIDAVWLAEQGYRVHATDVAPGMQAALREKVVSMGLQDMISNEICSYTALEGLQNRGPFDAVFSNFAGLNCTGDLEKVLLSLSSLVRPGGHVTLVILPGFCLWESLLVFKGMFRTATRRWGVGSGGAASRVEGTHFRCWYYSPSYVARVMKPDFELLEWEGLCTIVPPSYIEGFAEKYPRFYDRLCRLENGWKGRWPWRSIGDYYVISFRRRG
jgi:ubiquinone/menaquinone biosynthesis C-methylase UbiE